jgi:hypothetical protein
MIPFSATSGPTIGFPPVAGPRSSTMSSSGEVRQAAVLRACAVTPRRGRTSPSSKSSRKNRRVGPLTGHPRSATQSRLAASVQIDRTRRAHVSRRLQLRRRAPCHFGLRAVWQPLGQDHRQGHSAVPALQYRGARLIPSVVPTKFIVRPAQTHHTLRRSSGLDCMPENLCNFWISGRVRERLPTTMPEFLNNMR